MSITAGFSLLAQFALTAGYCLLVLVSLHLPASGLAQIMAQWDQRLRPVLGPILEALGKSPCAAHGLSGLRLYDAYVELVIVNLAIAASCYLACAPFWKDWAKRLRRHPRWARASAQQVESELEIGQGLTLAGGAGAAWILVDAPYPARACVALDPWLFLRVPLIVTVVYGLACFCAAFGSARSPTD
jgi:hypothetical protein